MGVDASAIFDCRFSRQELFGLGDQLRQHHRQFAEIFSFEEAKESVPAPFLDDADGTYTEIGSRWPFGLWVLNDGLLCLWNSSRWKFILEHGKGHYREFFASTRLVARIVKAGRIIYLSDHALGRIDTSGDFDSILSALGTPDDDRNVFDIVAGYESIFFYESIDS